MSFTQFLTPGDTIQFRGDEYVIVKVNPKNYVIAKRDGSQYRLDRRAAMEHLGRDTAWLRDAKRERIEQTLERSGLSADDPNVGVFPSGLPRFKAGTQVRITGKGARRFEGKVGTIARVNRARYAVAVPGTGQVNVPFTMTVLATASELDVAITPRATHPLVGVEFRYLIGDEKVLFKVTEVDGKVLTAVGQKDDYEFTRNGKTESIPSDYEGTVRDFLTAEVQGIVDFEAKWAALAKQGA